MRSPNKYRADTATRLDHWNADWQKLPNGDVARWLQAQKVRTFYGKMFDADGVRHFKNALVKNDPRDALLAKTQKIKEEKARKAVERREAAMIEAQRRAFYAILDRTKHSKDNSVWIAAEVEYLEMRDIARSVDKVRAIDFEVKLERHFSYRKYAKQPL